MPDKRVERQFQGYVLQLLDKVIARHPEWPLRAHAIQEEERSDILIKDSEGKVFLLIELKDYTDPRFATPYTRDITDQALRYSETLGNRYYITWNMITGVLWDRMEPRAYSELGVVISLAPSTVEYYRNNLRLDKRLEEELISQLDHAVSTVVDLSVGKKWEYKELDEKFIDRIEALLDSHVGVVASAAQEKYQRDADFRKSLIRYVKDEQDWPWPDKMADREIWGRLLNLTRLAFLLLTIKAIFYHTLFTFRKGARLRRLTVPETLRNRSDLKDYLWRDYFSQVIQRIDYEGLLGKHPTFMDDLPFVSEGSVSFVRHLVENILDFNFSEVSHDVIGKIYEKLIDREHRHQMGQYFTLPDIADLIIAFTIKRGSETVMDAGSGSGTFSVRAYQRMADLLPGQDHWERLMRIWSCEIAPYPAHLTTLNMVIRDLRHEKNYPRVINEDFFKLTNSFEARVKNPDGTDDHVNLPRFNAVIGNPPYTRQEEMKHIDARLKARAHEVCLMDWPGIRIPKTSSLFAYFMLHGGALLTDGGRLGMITSNSWLDVDYGKAVQEMLLRNFKLIAVMDSKVERWFQAADVNTCITIAERCSDESKRQDNMVRFVYLLVRLDDLWRHYTVDRFADEIEGLKRPGVHQNRFYRAFVIRQSKLLAEATDPEGNFVGEKWGKYMRAPAVYFKILDRARDRMVPMSSIARIRRGFTTGATKFFFLRDITEEIPEAERPKHTGLSERERVKKDMMICLNGLGAEVLIEGRYLRPVARTPREIRGLLVRPDDLAWRILWVDYREKYPLRGKEVLRYMERWGEQRMRCQEKPTCKARKPWWWFGEWKPADQLWPELYSDSHRVPMNPYGVLESDKFYGITYKRRNYDSVKAFLNSTFVWLIRDICGFHSLGEGVLKMPVYEVANLPVIDNRKLRPELKGKLRQALLSLSDRPIGTVFDEVKMTDRRELDLTVLEALGFEDKREREIILEELYSAVCEMVKDRLEKAKRAGKEDEAE